MVYTPQAWADGPAGGTPISSARLAHIETGLKRIATFVLTVEDFGGIGDGTTDDTTAFAAMATAINVAGIPATVALRPDAVYRVGRQTLAGNTTSGGSYLPTSIFNITSIPSLTIHGNGATIKFNDGLRAGTFDPVTGAVFGTVNVAIAASGNSKYVAAPGNIIEIYSTERVAIHDLIVDGNDAAFVKGGGIGVAGTTDYSVAGTGILLQKVHNATISNINIHHMVLDGMSFSDKSTTPNAEGNSITIHASSFTYVGRNGLWLASCSNVHAASSKFNHCGRGNFTTAPAIGIDFEAYAPNNARRGLIEACEFVDNFSRGYSMSSGWGHLLFKVCGFRASGNRAEFATPTGPWVSHEDCSISGFVNLLGVDSNDTDSELKPFNGTAFRRCVFDDADYIQPVVFLDGAGIPTLQAEAKQTYGIRTGTVAITASLSGTANRWKCQVLYNGSVVEVYDPLNTVPGALASLNTSGYVVFTDLGSPSANPTSQPTPVTAVTLPVTILDRSNGGLVAKAYDNALFEDCTFMPHAVTAFNMSTNSTLVYPMTVRRCTVVPYNSAVADRANQSQIRQTFLDGLKFIEPPAPINEVQTVTITGSPTAGSFTLSLWGFPATAVAFNASAATLQSALAGISIIGAGNVTVSGAAGGPYTVTFVGALAGMDITQFISSNTFSGGTTPNVVVATVTTGKTGLTPPATGWFVSKDASVTYSPNGATVGPSIHWGTFNGPTGLVTS